MFEVYGTPGVDVYICPSVERDRERAEARRWHFDVGSQIVVVMNSPSNELNDSHVSARPCLGVTGGGGRPSSTRAPCPLLSRMRGNPESKSLALGPPALRHRNTNCGSAGHSHRLSEPVSPPVAEG